MNNTNNIPDSPPDHRAAAHAYLERGFTPVGWVIIGDRKAAVSMKGQHYDDLEVTHASIDRWKAHWQTGLAMCQRSGFWALDFDCGPDRAEEFHEDKVVRRSAITSRTGASTSCTGDRASDASGRGTGCGAALNPDDHEGFTGNYRSLLELIKRELGVAEITAVDFTDFNFSRPSIRSRVTRWLPAARARERRELTESLAEAVARLGRDDRSVFISYRRELSESLARLVRDDLSKNGFDAFMDLDNLDSGEFEREILSQIEGRKHFIVLLEPGSLDQIDKDDDWLRREIAHALDHGRNVVPVTAKGFEFRKGLRLPPNVARLASYNAVTIPPLYFDAAMERLRIRFLKIPSNP